MKILQISKKASYLRNFHINKTEKNNKKTENKDYGSS